MIRFLQRLRILDENGDVSITHACLVFVCVCIWKRVPIALPEFGSLALALGAYQAKKVLAARAPEARVENDPASAQRDQRLAAVEKSVADVAGELRQIRNGQAWAGVVAKR